MTLHSTSKNDENSYAASTDGINKEKRKSKIYKQKK